MTQKQLRKKLEKQYDAAYIDTLQRLTQKNLPLDKITMLKILLESERDYWLERLSAIDEYYYATATQAAKILTIPYMKAAWEYKEQIKQIYGSYRGSFDIPKATADKLLLTVKYDRTIADNLRAIANDPITPPDEQKKILAELSAPAYRYRMQRADAMVQSAQQTCKEIAGQEIAKERYILQSATEEAYNITLDEIIGKNPAEDIINDIKAVNGETQEAIKIRVPGVQDIKPNDERGVLMSFNEINDKAVREIVNHNWHGGNFSDRVWNDTDAVAKEIQGVLLKGELTGASVYDMAQEIEQRFNVAAYKARRLVRTEYNYCTNQATLRGYRDTGITKYRYLAIIDDKTSEICTELDGEIFDVAAATVGENYPPMHPNCRSTTVPVTQTVDEMQADIDDMLAQMGYTDDMDFDEFVSQSFAEIKKRRGIT